MPNVDLNLFAAAGVVSLFLLLSGYIFFSPAHSEVAEAAETINGPVVLELFTSQSCSSCPPADKLLGELAKQENVIALSCHVDYWNYLSWEDTQSRGFCTKRQREYSYGQNRKGRVFTPEIQINGHISTVGNRTYDVKAGIRQAALAPPKYIAISTKNGSKVALSLPEFVSSSDYTLKAYSYIAEVDQHIPRGENRGRDVTYTNSVQQEFDLGAWDGQNAVRLTQITDRDVPNNGGLVVVAQTRNGGIILAAGHFQK